MAIGDGHDISSPRFRGDPILEACFDNEHLMRIRETGPAVEKIQQALVELHYDLPKYGVDGIYGNETAAAVSRFQLAQKISSDGAIGPITMHALDRLFMPASFTLIPNDLHLRWVELAKLKTLDRDDG